MRGDQLHFHPAPTQRPAIPAPPAGAGVCLKACHYRDVLAAARAPAFFEIHAENYLHDGGPAHRYLEAIRHDHRLSVHGVGLSLGGVEPPSPGSIAARAALLRRYEPEVFSEHLAWCQYGAAQFNDLLPIACTPAALDRVVSHVQAVQEGLGRPILIENPATYLRFAASSMDEAGFISELVRRSGCGLLLDVNNVVVSAVNNCFDPREYLAALPLHAVGEVHLAGHALRNDSRGGAVCIDSHDGPVQASTWALYRDLLDLTGPLPTLIEWDGNLPDYARLLDEAGMADSFMRGSGESQHGVH